MALLLLLPLWFSVTYTAAALHLKQSSVAPRSSSSFHDLPLPVAMYLWLLVSFSSSVMSLFLLPTSLHVSCFLSLVVLRLLQTDVLSHHLQRNLIYLDSQVRSSDLIFFSLSWYFSLTVYPKRKKTSIWWFYSHFHLKGDLCAIAISGFAESPHTTSIFNHQNS